MHSKPISRRRFVAHTTMAAFSTHLLLAADAGPKKRAVIIGDTGHGDYGHGLDVALTGVPQVEVLAVADPDPAGRARAAERAGAHRQYEDFRKMLREEKPDLVVIAPRWSEGHYGAAIEALKGGAGFTGRAPGGPSRWSTKRSTEWTPLEPTLVVEVSFDHVSGGRFRHGTSLLRWRPDKAARQCTMDQLKQKASRALSLLET